MTAPLEVTAVIKGTVPVGRLASALAGAGLTLHHDARRDALIIEPALKGSPVRPVADGLVGMAWFNGLTRAERLYWLNKAASATPAEAWEAFKAERA